MKGKGAILIIRMRKPLIVFEKIDMVLYFDSFYSLENNILSIMYLAILNVE